MSEHKSRAGQLVVEAVVIVGSILLAFAIDAYWEGLKEEQRETAIVRAMVADFTSARAQLAMGLEGSRDLLARTEALQSAAGSRVALPQDSIVFLGESVVVGSWPLPSLPRYRAAVAAGELNLLESDSLLLALNDFEKPAADYARWQDQMRAAFVSGALHDLRQQLGTLSVLHPSGGRMSTPSRFIPTDLNEVIQRRSVYAAVEPVHVARFNYVTQLGAMDEAAIRVLSALADIDADQRRD